MFFDESTGVFSSQAILALQEAAEAYLVGLFEDGRGDGVGEKPAVFAVGFGMILVGVLVVFDVWIVISDGFWVVLFSLVWIVYLPFHWFFSTWREKMVGGEVRLEWRGVDHAGRVDIKIHQTPMRYVETSNPTSLKRFLWPL